MIKTKLMQGVRLAYRKVFKPQFPSYSGWDNEHCIITNKMMYDMLVADEPCYIGRFGTVEGAIVLNYLTVHSDRAYVKRIVDYIKDNTRLPWWDTELPFKQLRYNAGYFNTKTEELTIPDAERFAKIYLNAIQNIDLCGRFCYQEKYYPFKEDCKMAQLETLYPFFVDKPWMAALKGKKVLVVHPFKDTIIAQYGKRDKLFDNPDTLPNFDLKVIKAVQSIAGEKCEYKDWFEALDAMKQQISATDFDIAILGCGAYATPLAAYIKTELKKKAIHMGGGTQLLFGIKGKRWEKDYQNSCYRDMWNEHWVYPSENEKPKNAKSVEGGCYW